MKLQVSIQYMTDWFLQDVIKRKCQFWHDFSSQYNLKSFKRPVKRICLAIMGISYHMNIVKVEWHIIGLHRGYYQSYPVIQDQNLLTEGKEHVIQQWQKLIDHISQSKYGVDQKTHIRMKSDKPSFILDKGCFEGRQKHPHVPIFCQVGFSTFVSKCQTSFEAMNKRIKVMSWIWRKVLLMSH